MIPIGCKIMSVCFLIIFGHNTQQNHKSLTSATTDHPWRHDALPITWNSTANSCVGFGRGIGRSAPPLYAELRHHHVTQQIVGKTGLLGNPKNRPTEQRSCTPTIPNEIRTHLLPLPLPRFACAPPLNNNPSTLDTPELCLHRYTIHMQHMRRFITAKYKQSNKDTNTRITS